MLARVVEGKTRPVKIYTCPVDKCDKEYKSQGIVGHLRTHGLTQDEASAKYAEMRDSANGVPSDPEKTSVKPEPAEVLKPDSDVQEPADALNERPAGPSSVGSWVKVVAGIILVACVGGVIVGNSK